MDSTELLSRRKLLKSAAGLSVAPLVVPASALGRQGAVAPSDRVAIGVIGVGNRAKADLSQMLPQKDARIAGICDVDAKARDAALTLINGHYGDRGCREYRDFRELLGRSDIDAVMIATPDHWHVPMIVAAARAGKDMFCEKPMGLAISWAQAARAAVRRHGVVFQFGTQQRTQRYFMYAVRLAQSGALGELKCVRTWVPDSEYRERPSAPARIVRVPDYLDWDMWLGPAPYTPYTEGKQRGWYGNSDYSHGTICNWGVHNLDICLWGLSGRVARVMEVEGTASFPRDGDRDNARGWEVVYRFDHGVPIHYVSLGRVPEEWRRRYQWQSDHAVVFEGSEGWVHANRLWISADPPGLLKDVGVPRGTRDSGSGFALMRNFLDCVRSRHTPAAGIEQAVQADTAGNIADLAVRLGAPLRWDVQNERFLDRADGIRLMTRAMRSPWQV